MQSLSQPAGTEPQAGCSLSSMYGTPQAVPCRLSPAGQCSNAKGTARSCRPHCQLLPCSSPNCSNLCSEPDLLTSAYTAELSSGPCRPCLRLESVHRWPSLQSGAVHHCNFYSGKADHQQLTVQASPATWGSAVAQSAAASAAGACQMPSPPSPGQWQLPGTRLACSSARQAAGTVCVLSGHPHAEGRRGLHGSRAAGPGL